MIIIHKKNSHYTLEAKNDLLYLNPLFESIIEIQLLPFSFIENNKLHFHAQSVCLLEDYLINNNNTMNVENILFFLYSISKQITSLEHKGFTFYGISLKDVIVVNKNIFLILNTSTILPIENGYITFLFPFEKPYFANPEILAIDSLPCQISHKCIYYSLAALTIYCLFNNYILKGNDLLSNSELDAILFPIYGTKLYWCLKRCLENDCDKRYLLYI
jgi:hypothetical protein